jgi:hypothetical protein
MAHPNPTKKAKKDQKPKYSSSYAGWSSLRSLLFCLFLLCRARFARLLFCLFLLCRARFARLLFCLFFVMQGSLRSLALLFFCYAELAAFLVISGVYVNFC